MKTGLAILLLATLCLLSACGGPTQAPNKNLTEKPLFTDADIDKAQLQMPTEVKELVGIEAGITPEGRELPELPDRQGVLSTRAVSPYGDGYVYYLEDDLYITHSYSLYRHDQRTDTLTLLYYGERPIQSVAGDFSGNYVVVSMKETTDASSDYEIFHFHFKFDGDNHPDIFQLTYDTVDNTNVSTSFDALRIVYEEPVAGKASVVLRTRQAYAPPLYDSVVLSHPDPQHQPSISQNGQYLTFVRDLIP